MLVMDYLSLCSVIETKKVMFVPSRMYEKSLTLEFQK